MKQVMHLLRRSLKEGFHVALKLLRIMVPVIIVVKLLDVAGATRCLGWALGPAMHALGLPDIAGLVFGAALLTGVYGGLSAIGAIGGELSLTTGQATVLAALILIAHGLPVEARVAQKLGVSLWFTVFFRVANSFFFACLVHLLVQHTGVLQQPAANQLTSAVATGPSGIVAWTVMQILSLAKMTAIIIGLVLGMNIIKALRQEKLLEILLGPVLRVIGISPRASGITIVGVLLGISYGGGLIAAEAQSGAVSRRDVVYSLCLLGLIHSIIEDTALMLLIGANGVVIIGGRILYALLVIALLVAFTRSVSPERFERWFGADAPRSQVAPGDRTSH